MDEPKERLLQLKTTNPGLLIPTSLKRTKHDVSKTSAQQYFATWQLKIKTDQLNLKTKQPYMIAFHVFWFKSPSFFLSFVP